MRALRKAVEDLDGQPMRTICCGSVRGGSVDCWPCDTSNRGISFTLAYDLFMHRHSDLFDLPRIRRVLDVLGLELLRS